MKFQRILIWIVAFTLAFFTGRTVIRNLWRLYYTPFEKALIIQDNFGGISDLTFNRYDKTGHFGDYHFRWKYYPWSNSIKLISLDSQNKTLDGIYSINVPDGEQVIILEKDGQYISRANANFQGIVCNGWSLEDWEINQEIPWF